MVEAAKWGVTRRYRDTSRRWRSVPRRSVEAILESMGAGEDGRDDPGNSPVLTVRLDMPMPDLGPGRLVFEDGGEARVGGLLPQNMPAGYHRFERLDGGPLSLIATPGLCPLPQARAWGVAAQLYAARTDQSWGFGDLRDLRVLGGWAGDLGAGFVMINPLHAPTPGANPEPSPYFPSSRSFYNPLYIAVEEVDGAGDCAAFREAAAAGRALNDRRIIDRSAVWQLKSAVLEEAFERGWHGERFDNYRRERGALLDRFATYCALVELHGADWRRWAAELRDPEAHGVRAFAASPRGSQRVLYHAWLQWLLDEQVGRAAAVLPIVNDFAVGVDPGGADTWMWPGVFAQGVSVGAPPDTFNPAGQDWGVAPMDPWRLRDRTFEPFVEALRAGFRHGGGVRLDHVMSLFRLFWIPAGEGPAAGGYVRYPHEDLLGVVALEAERAGSFAVGEDLGTVEDGVRAALAARDVLGCKVWWLERDRPATWRKLALGSLGTHDLPTIAGFFSGADLRARRKMGLLTDEDGWEEMVQRLLAAAGCGPSSSIEDVVKGAHRDLARAPCFLLTASLDDLFAVEERPNMPGTVDAWPNWSLALPLPLERLQRRRLPKAVARVLRDRSVDPSTP